MQEDLLSAILRSMEPGASPDPLLHEESNRVSLLHSAIRLHHEKKHEIVKFLIESGLVECDQRDVSDRTAIEVVLTQFGDRELAEVMLCAELVNLDECRGFYVMIRRGSVPVYRLFLEMKKLKEERVFCGVSNAMIELNVRRVPLTMEMTVYLQYQLAKFAHGKLFGDVGGAKNPNEWRTHFAEIEDHWMVLKEKFSDRNFVNVDNEFMFRIKTIHNHLYFVKDKRFLKHLPIMETTYCLAILLSIWECGSEFELYKFLINKVNIMQYLEAICRQLKHVKTYLDKLSERMNVLVNAVSKDKVPSKEQLQELWIQMNPSMSLQENIANKLISGLKKKLEPTVVVSEIVSSEVNLVSVNTTGRDKSVLHKLKQNYFKAKQLYSIQKCILNLEAVTDLRKTIDLDYVTVPAVKRFIQVVGEAIKSTKNSPNVPKKVEKLLSTMLTALFPNNNKYFREFLSHKYPMAKKFLSESAEANLFCTIASQSEYAGMIFSIILICSMLEISRTLLGTMRRCRDNAELRSLLQYIHTLILPEAVQMKYYDKIMRKFKDMEQSINATDVQSAEDLESVRHLRQDLHRKSKVIDELRKTLLRNWKISFQDIKDACLANAPIATIRRMIDWNLSLSELKNIYQIIHTHWMQNHVTLSSLHPKNSKLMSMDGTVSSGILEKIERKLVAIKGEECVANTREILLKLGVIDPTTDVLQNFHKQLAKYYEDIFFIDNKFMAIRKFFKANKLPCNEENLKTMRTRDEQDLQNMFDERIENMRTILQKVGITSIDSLSNKLESIPTHALIALELCQLELCEMLITIGYYGDNFYLLKHRIPLIYGRNYRNYLAHDSLCYNVLTDSTRMTIYINALAFTSSKVSLFKKNNQPKFAGFTFPKEVEALHWTLEQISLVETIKLANFEAIKSGDLFGRHCAPVDKINPMSFDMTSIEFVNPNSETFEKSLKFFAAKISENTSKISTPGYCIWYALQLEHYEEAFHMLKKVKSVRNSNLPQELFSWDLIIDYLLTEMTDWDERDASGRSVLHRLLQAGNCDRVQLLLEIMPEIDVNAIDKKGRTPLDYAIGYGCTVCVRNLLSKSATVSSANLQMGMINHMNDSLVELLRGFREESLISAEYILTAVRSNNLTALKLLVDKFYNVSHKYIRAEHLNACMSLAAYLNHYKIVEYLSILPNVNYFSDDILENGNIALQHATKRRHKRIVKLLLNLGASPNWINTYSPNTLKTAFQLAVDTNNRKLVVLMYTVDRTLYLNNNQLRHPVQCAVQDNSPKMIRCLGRFGFSLLDTGSILQTAIRFEATAMINAIFKELDLASRSVDSLQDPVLHAVGVLLNRWRTMAYLEEPNVHHETNLYVAVTGGNLQLVTSVLERCEESRRFGESYLQSVTVYNNRKQVNSYFCEDMLEKRFLLRECDELLNKLTCFKQRLVESSVRIVFRSELKENEIDVIYKVAVESDSAPDLVPITIYKACDADVDRENLSEACFQLILDHFENLNFSIYGSFLNHHFIICGESSYLLQTVDSQQPLPLKSLVNFPTTAGETPLHNCYGMGRIDITKLLISHGANPIAMNSSGQTPLHLALIDKDAEKAMYLLKLCIDRDLRSSEGIPVAELPNRSGFRPLHLAVMTSKLDVVRLLIEHCKVDLRARDTMERVPIIYALAGPHIPILQLLLHHDPGAVNIPDSLGQTLVHYTAVRCYVEVVKMLFQYDGVDLFASNKRGANPVEVAMENKSLQWLKVVLEYARSQKITRLFKPLNDRGIPALHYTLLYSDPEFSTSIVEYEIDASLNDSIPPQSLQKLKDLLTARTEDEGYTPLHVGVTLGLVKSTEFVLKCQNLYNQQSDEKLNLVNEEVDLSGRTPLDRALDVGNELLINILLDNQ